MSLSALSLSLAIREPSQAIREPGQINRQDYSEDKWRCSYDNRTRIQHTGRLIRFLRFLRRFSVKQYSPARHVHAEKQRYDGWYNNLAHQDWGAVGEFSC